MGPEIVLSAAAGVLFAAPLLRDAFARRGIAPQSGAASLVGATGRVLPRDGSATQEHWVLLRGERWRARCAEPLREGDTVRVERVDGLAVHVRATPGVATGEDAAAAAPSPRGPWLAAGALWSTSLAIAALGPGSLLAAGIACPIAGLAVLVGFGSLAEL